MMNLSDPGTSEPLLTQLVRRLARQPSDSERHRARLHLLDWLACVAGARQTEAGSLGAIISHKAWEKSTYLGNVLGVDDFHRPSCLHPGPVIWPAALSLPSASFDQRLDAAIRGYEAMIAIGCALDAHHHAHWDSTSTAGVFGSTVAFGSLIGFAPVEFANAMGNAGSVAGGLRHMWHDDVLTRQWHIYHAVRTGRDAAMHVHYGATGPQAILEGEQGLFAAMTQEPGPLAGTVDGWLIGDVRFALWDASRQTSPAIDRMLETADDQGDPDRPVGEAEIIDKMHKLSAEGGLAASEAELAAKIALHGDDAAALDSMLEKWLGG